MRNTRKRAHKGYSAGKFRHAVSQTHPRNMAQAPRRGGWRL